MNKTPLLLLDVDGVLNALADFDRELTAWDDYVHGEAKSTDNTWPIVFSPTVISRLLDLHARGRVEIQWLTTWGHEANGDLRHLLGLPELAVAGTYQDEDGREYDGDAADTEGRSLAQVTPSAPHALGGSWWKFDIVRRLHAADPDRPLIWVDDELHRPGNPYSAWASERDALAVGPDPTTGLSKADLDDIEGFLRAMTFDAIHNGTRQG